MRPAHLAHERRGADLFVAARQSPAVPRVERAASINLGTLSYHSAGKPRPAAPADPNSINKTHYLDYAQPDRTGGGHFQRDALPCDLSPRPQQYYLGLDSRTGFAHWISHSSSNDRTREPCVRSTANGSSELMSVPPSCSVCLCHQGKAPTVQG